MQSTIRRMLTVVCWSCVFGCTTFADEAAVQSRAGWAAKSPRDEIRPSFRIEPAAGQAGDVGTLIIEADARPGLYGWWEKTVPVQGGATYRFSVRRRTTGVDVPRRAAVARLLWRDANGQQVLRDEVSNASFLKGTRPRAEAEYPVDQPPGDDGWVEVAGVYQVPGSAAAAVIELYYQWEPTGQVEWTDVRLDRTDPLPPRPVRLATVHFCPREGTTLLEKCQSFEPLIRKAAEQHADLIVLGETLTYYGSRQSFAECAEPIPGVATDYFGKLAKQHDCYIVAGLVERDGHLVFNVAVLIGPDGAVVGKYRKVTLPRTEIELGVTPGTDYPVFETRFGKVGMMVCYDGFFPEVARELSNRGAEVIAWPVWGCNPLLAAARACENHVYLVSSTYTDVSSNWTISAVYAHDGRPLVQAQEWGDVVVAEVDLNQTLYWHSLGSFRAQLARHRPVAVGEKEHP